MSTTTTETKLKKMQFTVGSDPELFVRRRSDGKIISSLRVLPQDKHEPVSLGNGIYVYSDNILMEAKLPPATTKGEFIGIFRETFSKMKEYLGVDYELVPVASYEFDAGELEDPRAWIAGCSANFNCYTESINETVQFENGLRTGSCHVHLGAEKLCDFDTRHEAIKLLDIFVGCSSIIFDKDASSLARRKYYGQAGEMRPSSFGLEYRILSPFILRSPQLIDLVYDLVDFAMSIVESGNQKPVLSLVKSEDVIHTINTCNIELAEKILKQVNLPEEFQRRIHMDYNPDNFYGNWGI